MTRLYKQIIIAVDNSPESEYAFQTALGIAKRNLGSVLHIVHVIDTNVMTPMNPALEITSIERAQQEADEVVARHVRQAEDFGLQYVKPVIELASPRSFIAKDYAKAVGADLIICGATGKSGFRRMMMGSVSEGILRSSICDVLIIRTPEHLWGT